MSEAAALLVDGDSIWYFDGTEHPYEIADPFAACGSGAMAALAVLHCGGTTKDAVRIAAKIDPHTSGKIRTMEV